MRTPTVLLARGEVIIRNNGATITLETGEVVEAGDVAVVAAADRMAAVELLFGRFERDPYASKAGPPSWAPRARGVELNSAGVDVTEGVTLR